jgi:hypothetical protein
MKRLAEYSLHAHRWLSASRDKLGELASCSFVGLECAEEGTSIVPAREHFSFR